MSEEGRFFTTLGQGVPTYIPGGITTPGRVKSVQGNFMQLNFDSAPVVKGKVLADGTTLAHAAPTGAEGDENILSYPEGSLEWHVLGTQTLLAPVMVATGLNVGQDQTDNDGIELCGGKLAGNKLAFIVGTDPAFYAKMRFSIATVLGTDDCAFGFHKVENYQANIDDYDELVALNVISGNVTIETILNGGATVVTDTTKNWADGETHELEVRVSAAGVVTYKIDEGTPATVAAFTFDDGEVVIPFFYMLNANAAQAGAVTLIAFECGPQ